jgi:hypothetical protein
MGQRWHAEWLHPTFVPGMQGSLTPHSCVTTASSSDTPTLLHQPSSERLHPVFYDYSMETVMYCTVPHSALRSILLNARRSDRVVIEYWFTPLASLRRGLQPCENKKRSVSCSQIHPRKYITNQDQHEGSAEDAHSCSWYATKTNCASH